MSIALRIGLLLLIAIVAFMIFLYVQQDRMVFHPRPYQDEHLTNLPARATKIEYPTSCGQQVAWYVPPRSAALETDPPARLWILFGGNGSLAAFWSNGVTVSPDADAGYVMFDYPGYGYCEGKPDITSINESADAMLVALAAHLGLTAEQLLDRPIRLMGHSLGSGAALSFATRHRTDRLVLAAPFTSMRAVARQVVTPAFAWLLRHNFDNRANLRTVLAAENPPQVIITHGNNDPVIPSSMSREMKSEFGDAVDYIELDHADHVNVLDDIEYYMAPALPRPVESLEAARNAATQQK